MCHLKSIDKTENSFEKLFTKTTDHILKPSFCQAARADVRVCSHLITWLKKIRCW